MYGRKASQLLKEFVNSETGQITGFNNDLFDEVIQECNGQHVLHLHALLRKVHEEGSDNQTNKNADHFGALVHHLSLVRNKRCLMAYVYNRAEIIQKLGWTIIHKIDLPTEVKYKLSRSEKEYFEERSATLLSYMKDMDLDLAVDMVPPKDPYIKVRVIEEIADAEVTVGAQQANLAMHAILFLRRTDAETYISQGKMEELTS